MQVLHPTTTFPRHPDDHWGPFILDLCNALSGKGVDVEVLASNGPGVEPLETPCTVTRFDYFLGKRFQTLMTPPGLIPNLKKRPWRAIQAPFFYWALGNHIRKRARDADIVHAHWLIPTGLAAVHNTEKPVVAAALGQEYHLKPDGVLAKLVRRVHERADAVVTLSEYMRRRGVEQYGCPAEKLHVIPNAADTTAFQPDVETAFRKEQGIPEDAPLIVTVRRLVPEKRVDALIDALPTVLEDVEDAVVCIVGDGPERGRLEQKADRLGVAANVVFAGTVPHARLPEVFAASDVFALTTEQEGMSTALLEAMASGLPAVATDAVSNAEVVEDGRNGALYALGDTEALADALTSILTRPATRQRMGAAARERVVEQFSYDAVAERYVALYEDLVD